MGIEIGADINGQDYHMLAYKFDHHRNNMIEFIRRVNEKSNKMCSYD